jgi:hypothetical protein
MIIAAHIVAATVNSPVLYRCLVHQAKENPAVKFIFLSEDKEPASLVLPDNCSILQINPALKNGLIMHYWYNLKLPSLLKKNNVTHFISESGACSVKTRISQFLLISNISFLQKKSLFAQAHSAYIKRFFPKFLQSVKSILVTENFIADHISEKFPATKNKLQYIGHGLSEAYQPVTWEEKQAMLQEFTNGTEYFISECTIASKQNLLILLKAFSLFKKRQKSAMQLVLMMNGNKIEDFVKDFNLYKYRDDVKIVTHDSEAGRAKKVACAYAFIYLPQRVIAENTALNALQAGIPLITIENTDAFSIYGQAALYSQPSEKAIAENMMLLYKDEILRNDHIQKGWQVSSTYNWPLTSAALWEVLSSG